MESCARVLRFHRVRPDGRYDEVFRRLERDFVATEARLAREYDAAERWFGELAHQPPARRRLLLDNRPDLVTWSLGRRLVEGAESLLASEPRQAAELAGLALEISKRVDLRLVDAGRIADLAARAWVARAEVHRNAGRPVAAATALRRAEECLAEGTGDPLHLARFFTAQADLAASRGDGLEAAALGAVAAVLRREAGAAEEDDEDAARSR